MVSKVVANSTYPTTGRWLCKLWYVGLMECCLVAKNDISVSTFVTQKTSATKSCKYHMVMLL